MGEQRPALVPELQAIGEDVIVVDSPDVSKEIKEAVGQAELRLAFDGVSGPTTGVLASTFSPHGTLVSFAAMTEAPISISALDVIFKRSPYVAFGSAIRRLRPKERPL